MAASLNTLLTSSFIPTKDYTFSPRNPRSYTFNHSYYSPSVIPRRRGSLKIQAAKLPAGVELPKVQPKFQAPFLGFTRTAEIWNSRACMIGLIGIFIVELIINKGVLQVIGVEVGKGLNLPL